MSRIAIIGGGISGLALAYHLEQRLRTTEVLVLESAGRVGGTIQTEEVAGYRVERGPNGFLDSKPTTLNLARELDLNDQLLAASESAGKNRFLFLRDRLHRLPSGPLSLLFSSVLSWRSKWALLTERYRRTPPPTGEESFASFVSRRVNPEIASTLADAFVTGIFAGDSTLLSVQAAFPRLAEYEREHGSIVKGFIAAARARRQAAAAEGKPYQRGGKMWSFVSGLGTLVDRLRERLRSTPRTGVEVRAVIPRLDGSGGYRVLAAGNDLWDVDRVVLACPAYRQAEILADLDSNLAGLIAEIPYNRVVVAALGYAARDVRMSLDGFGYLTPGRERRDILGVQWCSSIFPGQRAPRDTVLLRAMCGGWHRPEMVDWSDEQLLSALRAELARTMKIEAAPVFHRLIRWERAIPQYNIGHLDRLVKIDAAVARHPGLYLAGNSYRGVAMNDCVENASLLAERIATQSAHPEPR